MKLPVQNLHRLLACTLVCAATANSPQAEEAYKTAAEQLWQPQTAKQLKEKDLPAYCGGYYLKPVQQFTEEPFLEADQAEFALGKHVKLQGNIILQNGGHQVTAEQADYDVENQRLSLSDQIALRSQNTYITSDYAEIGVDASEGNFKNTSYLVIDQQLRGTAERIARNGEKSLIIENGKYTQCAPDDETWFISTKSLELNLEEGVGVAKGATINLWQKPVIYIPYLPFPIGETRKSGLLWPSISTASDSKGIDIALPFYWNIAPEADATITPRNVGSRAAGLEIETRYLHKHSDAVLFGGFFADSETNEDRWIVGFEESGQFNQHFFHEVSITRVSDIDYIDDFDAVSFDIRRTAHLKQMGALSYWDGKQSAKLSVTQYQTIESGVRGPYKALPQFQWRTLQKDVSGKLGFIGHIDYGHFNSQDTTRDEGQRLFYETGATLPYNWQAGFVKTTAKIKGIEYYPADSSADVSHRSELLSIDTGLNLERWNDGKRITLQPRAYYLYASGVEQQLNPLFDTTLATDTVERRYKDSQFIGYDRLDNANDLTLGLSAKWYNENAREIFGAAIAQTFLLSDKTIDLDGVQRSESAASNIVSSIYWRGVQNLKVEAHTVLDKNLANVVNGHARAVYTGDDGILFGITQVYNSNETLLAKRHQTEVSTAMPVNDQWTAYGQLHYDYINKRTVQQTFGLAREDCCWRLRLVAQESLEPSGLDGETETSFHLQFELKGLGGTGNSAVKVLEDAIYGFKHDQ